ncbi:hypothetical protein VTO42DRAFT_4586 [Malbranchea cinnamomea]
MKHHHKPHLGGASFGSFLGEGVYLGTAIKVELFARPGVYWLRCPQQSTVNKKASIQQQLVQMISARYHELLNKPFGWISPDSWALEYQKKRSYLPLVSVPPPAM